MSDIKQTMILLTTATVVAIVALFFTLGGYTNISEILFGVSFLIIGAIYVNQVMSTKKRTSEEIGKELSVLDFFRIDKSLFFLGLALLLFGIKMILQWLETYENISISLHLMALGFFMLSIAFKQKKTRDNEGNSSS